MAKDEGLDGLAGLLEPVPTLGYLMMRLRIAVTGRLVSVYRLAASRLACNLPPSHLQTVTTDLNHHVKSRLRTGSRSFVHPKTS